LAVLLSEYGAAGFGVPAVDAAPIWMGETWAALPPMTVAGFLPVGICLIQGQDSILLLLIIAGAYAMQKGGRGFASGFGFGAGNVQVPDGDSISGVVVFREQMEVAGRVRGGVFWSGRYFHRDYRVGFVDELSAIFAGDECGLANRVGEARARDLP
jgi:hypothetical protein